MSTNLSAKRILLLLGAAFPFTPTVTAQDTFFGTTWTCDSSNFNPVPLTNYACTWTEPSNGEVKQWWALDEDPSLEIWGSQTVVDPAPAGCTITESKSGDHGGSLATTNLIQGTNMRLEMPPAGSTSFHPAPGKDLAGKCLVTRFCYRYCSSTCVLLNVQKSRSTDFVRMQVRQTTLGL